jgi:NitT/TauT family transport system substrate-binding protein
MKRFIYTLLLSLIGTCSLHAQSQVVFTPAWTAQAQFAGFYVADALGFFKEE